MMDLEIFEISFRRKVSFDEISRGMSKFLGIPHSKIIIENDFWDLPNGKDVEFVGLDMLYSDTGYETFAKGVSYCDIFEEKLSDLAKFLAKELDTIAVIGNYLSEEGEVGDFIAFFPDGTRKFALEVSNGGGVFEIKFI
jgi:hypothetical protein